MFLLNTHTHIGEDWIGNSREGFHWSCENQEGIDGCDKGNYRKRFKIISQRLFLPFNLQAIAFSTNTLASLKQTRHGRKRQILRHDQHSLRIGHISLQIALHFTSRSSSLTLYFNKLSSEHNSSSDKCWFCRFNPTWITRNGICALPNTLKIDFSKLRCTRILNEITVSYVPNTSCRLRRDSDLSTRARSSPALPHKAASSPFGLPATVSNTALLMEFQKYHRKMEFVEKRFGRQHAENHIHGDQEEQNHSRTHWNSKNTGDYENGWDRNDPTPRWATHVLCDNRLHTTEHDHNNSNRYTTDNMSPNRTLWLLGQASSSIAIRSL